MLTCVQYKGPYLVCRLRTGVVKKSVCLRVGAGRAFSRANDFIVYNIIIN